MVLKPFAGTLSTGNVWQLVNKYRRLIKCDKQVGCQKKSLQDLLEVYVPQPLDDRYD